MKQIQFWFLFFILILLFPLSGFAHRVILFAWIEGEQIHTESKFYGGTPVYQGKIIVYSENQKILEGVTNQTGKFSFQIPKKNTLKIVLKEESGHQAEWKISQEELFSSLNSKKQKHRKQVIKQKQRIKVNDKIVQNHQKNLEILIEKAVEKKIKPLIRMIAKLQQEKTQPSISEVLGGIGYIIGLVGIGAYFSARKKNQGE